MDSALELWQSSPLYQLANYFRCWKNKSFYKPLKQFVSDQCYFENLSKRIVCWDNLATMFQIFFNQKSKFQTRTFHWKLCALPYLFKSSHFSLSPLLFISPVSGLHQHFSDLESDGDTSGND